MNGNASLVFDGTVVRLSYFSGRVVKKTEERDFSGILNKQFIDVDELRQVVDEMFIDILSEQKMKITNLYITVPPEFVFSDTKNAHLSFQKTKKVSEKTRVELLSQASDEIDGSSIIDKDIVYYRPDGGGAIYNMVGSSATKIDAVINVVYAEKYFTQTVMDILHGVYFKNVKFVCENQAVARYLVPTSVRDNTCVIIRSSMFTTSISVVVGESIVAMKTYGMGFVHIINDLCVVESVDHITASALCEKAALNVKFGVSDVYSIYHGTVRKDFSASKINQIISSRIEEIAKEATKIISEFGEPLFKKNIFFCGGYIDNIQGAKFIMQEEIGINMEQLVCPLSSSRESDAVLSGAIAQVIAENK